MGKITNVIKGLIQLYRYYISPCLGHHCRFYPSCSEYMHTALVAHGLKKGSYLGLRRILRCHPWCPGGYDPVPEKRLNS